MSRSLAGVSTGARSAGVVLAAGSLVDADPAASIVLIGGLVLLTFGRGLYLDAARQRIVAAALAVIVVGLGVGAIRWQSLAPADIRGAQEVLGPTVLVGPPPAAAAAWLAVIGILIAGAAWSLGSMRGGWIEWSLALAEIGVLATAAATSFYASGVWVASMDVVLGSLAFAAAVVALTLAAGRMRAPFIWIGLALSAAAVAAAITITVWAT